MLLVLFLLGKFAQKEKLITAFSFMATEFILQGFYIPDMPRKPGPTPSWSQTDFITPAGPPGTPESLVVSRSSKI